jgi:hypothetical protein
LETAANESGVSEKTGSDILKKSRDQITESLTNSKKKSQLTGSKIILLDRTNLDPSGNFKASQYPNPKLIESQPIFESPASNIDKNQVNIFIEFRMKQISVVMINEISEIYQSHYSLSGIQATLSHKIDKTTFQCNMANIQIHDLTNYPNCLTSKDLSKIVPSEIFGIN